MGLDGLRGRWSGRTVACLASGPSLTAEDCNRIRDAGLPTVVANTTFRMAPWADILMAMDTAWWRNYMPEVEASFKGELWGYIKYPGVTVARGRLLPIRGNSGSLAIALAIAASAARIILLGYDCKFASDGRRHWHPDHPRSMGNASAIENWPLQFELVARCGKEHGTDIVNCSRDTALECFRRGDLLRELGVP